MTATDAIDAREYMSDLPPAPPEIERRRGMMILDWIVRDYIPRWLDLVPESRERTYALRRLPEIVDRYSLATHTAVVGAYDWADSAAGEALRDVARELVRVTLGELSYPATRAAAQVVVDAVAYTTALDAAVYATGEAVWATPQRAVGDTARAAVEAAVLAAARDAAQAAPQGTREAAVWDAAWQALAPTVAACQRAAHALADRLAALDHHPHA